MNSKTVYLLGGDKEVNKPIHDTLVKMYPDLDIVSLDPSSYDDYIKI